jgi:hypothetical protein
MSITLDAEGGTDLDVNAWNWGVLHHLVANARLFPEEVWAPKRYNGGGELDAAQVKVLADFLEETVLPALRPGERLFFDGTITDVPDDGTFYREESEQWKNYSLQHAVLERVIAFLRGAGGAVSFL